MLAATKEGHSEARLVLSSKAVASGAVYQKCQKFKQVSRTGVFVSAMTGDNSAVTRSEAAGEVLNNAAYCRSARRSLFPWDGEHVGRQADQGIVTEHPPSWHRGPGQPVSDGTEDPRS
jgi:hypothetical protein